MHAIFELNGVDGQLAVYDDKVIISRKGAFGFILFGGAGNKTIRFSSIRSVQFKAGSIWTNGYIQFGISGGREKDNTVILRAGEQSNIGAKIQEYIEKRIEEINSPKPSPSMSAADEILKLKQLLDMGIITQEEFDKKKKQLLEA
ncbi:MAG: SHOCT domain-containing protein [Thermoguttaceae bacterium]|nr:SHOCT domain-containing protein [Thermoguttaceae bacterium]